MPSRPTQMLSLVMISWPPVMKAWPTELEKRPMEKSALLRNTELLWSVNVPTAPSWRPTETLVTVTMALETVINPMP